MIDVDVLESTISDNFFYVLRAGGRAVLVDPIDGERAVEHLRQEGLEPVLLINTHFHHDHIGGNPAVFEAFPEIELVAGAVDADRIDDQQPAGHGVSRRLEAGDRLEFVGETLDVLDTPGHTPGHISLSCGSHLFSGDTIFVGGAGNCSFGGDPGVLFRTFRDVLADLPDDMTFYPGHDYAVRDIEFVLSIEPDNKQAQSMLERAKQTPERDIFLTTLGEERAYSPFMRYDEPPLQERLAAEYVSISQAERERSDSKDEAAFRTVRELRNRW